MGWLYVPGVAVLSSESSSFSEPITEPWATSSGTPMQRPFSWPGWKRRPWIALLSGTISRPSMAARGAESWISSLRDTRASHSAPPAMAEEQLTRATSGLTWPGWSQRYAQPFSSARTLTLIFESDLSKSEETYTSLVSRLRRDSSVRLKSARATFGNGSSSLLWTAEEGGEAWATPDARVSTRTNRGGSNGRVGRDRPLLARMVQLWRTPSDDSKRGGAARAESRLAQGHTLNLQDQTRSWPTPNANEDSYRLAGDSQQSHSLTPTARRFHQALASSMSGAESLNETRRLNPRFVEWLMGWPIGWTGFESVGTEWSRWWQLWRSRLFGGD